jgi:hypothetical protein
MQLADTAEQIQLNNRDRHLITELMPETEGRWVPGVEPGHATGKSKEELQRRIIINYREESNNSTISQTSVSLRTTFNRCSTD